MGNTLKQLNKAFDKRLKQLNKEILNVVTKNASLPIVVESLRYLRDLYILNQQSTDIIISLTAAIEEYEAYNNTGKDFHWNNFCEIVKLNMKEWLSVNDSV